MTVKMIIVLCFGALVYPMLTKAEEEVMTFAFRWHNMTAHGVADMDAEGGWMSHHIFASEISPGATIARDENKNIEVFRQDKLNACFARPIPKTTRTIWDFHSVLQVEREQNKLWDMGEVAAKKEYMECTGAKLEPSRLGNVAYLCEGLPIYALRQVSKKRSKRALPPGGGCMALCGICFAPGQERYKRSAAPLVNGYPLVPRLVCITGCPTI